MSIIEKKHPDYKTKMNKNRFQQIKIEIERSKTENKSRNCRYKVLKQKGKNQFA